jgi:FMN-dependent NADH-azoreductase
MLTKEIPFHHRHILSITNKGGINFVRETNHLNRNHIPYFKILLKFLGIHHRTTANIYSHIYSDSKKKMLNKLTNVLVN